MFKLNTLTFLHKHIKYWYIKTVKVLRTIYIQKKGDVYMLNKVKEE